LIAKNKNKKKLNSKGGSETKRGYRAEPFKGKLPLSKIYDSLKRTSERIFAGVRL